jgi:mono/diheme cytochrome c family protein/uncharacterized membrane protein
MAKNHLYIRGNRVLYILFMISIGVQQLSAPIAVHAQADSPKSLQRPAPRQSGPTAAGAPAAGGLFQQYCVRCHGADGTGKPARDSLAKIPNFTDPSWPAQRSDAQLLVSILDGKEPEMPSWRGKISEEQASGLVAHVRAFAPTPGTPKGASLASFHARFGGLQKELRELQRQGRELSKDSSGGAPPKPSQSPQHEVSGPSSPAAVGTPAVGELFAQHCVNCHGADGTGKPARDSMAKIPNFTDPSWPAQRSDAQLLVSILDGKEPEMPSWRGKISEEQASGLVAHVRAFAQTPGTPKAAPPPSTPGTPKAAPPPSTPGTPKAAPPPSTPGTPKAAPAPSTPGTPKAAPPASSNERDRNLEDILYELQGQSRRLEEILHELQRQSRKPPEDSPGSAPSKPSQSPQHKVSHPSGPTAVGTPAVSELFAQYCVKCHGADGTGKPVRGRMAKMPNFADPSWPAQRSDAQLQVSILDGKEAEMPSWRGKISEEQASSLVAHIRAFAPTPGTRKGASPASSSERDGRREKEQEESTPAELAEAKPQSGFFEKLILWLGNFHPPAVHFPIALLTFAAVAELLRMATGKPAFDAISRYCVWFGTLTAVVAGTLGWFLGGFRLSDPSWVMMTHRWLGTSTVVCAGLVLLLSEVSRHPDRRGTRVCFRVMLLVVALLVSVTGFFGGAVTFGLDHYTWPQ